MDLEDYKKLLEYRFNFVRNGYEFKYEEKGGFYGKRIRS